MSTPKDHSAPTRRDFAKAAGAVTLGTALASHQLSAQYVNKSTAKGGRIDVHHHHVPPGLGGFGGGGRGAGPAGAGRGRGGRGPWTPDGTLEQMEKFDIAV